MVSEMEKRTGDETTRAASVRAPSARGLGGARMLGPVARARLVLAVAAALAVWPAAARAADPGRWALTGYSRIPLVYYQGVTTDGGGHLFFDGVFSGLYRTDLRLAEEARQDVEIPPAVTAAEGYDHIGDIAWDGREGGRVLLPLECYYPGRPGGANSCGTGAIGVADPATLAWRYHVTLDPAEIAKAMWAEVSPDGRLLWTSSGDDLLAYRTADVAPAAAAPGGRVLHSVRRLAGAVPPSGITGATFLHGRLFVAGQSGDAFQVWSIDLRTGARRLEIERTIAGESEGLVTVRALGGVLHWIVTPLDPGGRPPTYGTTSNVLLHFAPVAVLRVRARLSAVPAGRRSRVRFTVTVHRKPVRGALVRFAGRRARTSRAGTVRFSVRPQRAGRRRAVVTAHGLRRGTATVRVVRR
jgi:hypothetical protein